jgi:hypothetical protein
VETYQNIKDFFWSAVQDTEAQQMFFTETQVLSWLNMAMTEMAQHSHYLDNIGTQNTADGTAAYVVGTDKILAVWRAEIDDEAIRPVTTSQLRLNDRDWRTKSGWPRFYYLDNINTDPGYFTMGLHSLPDNVYELRTYQYLIPADLTTGSSAHKIRVPKWAIYGVLWYMLSEAYLAETMRQNFDTSAYYRMLYEGIIDRLMLRTNDKIGAKSWAVGATPTVGVNDFWHNLPDTIPEPS